MYIKPELKEKSAESVTTFAAVAARSGMGMCKVTYVEK